ncbi:MAG TPA: CHC2 zinc finger domain-containing protein, partial [Paludibacter sp.]|nr:CHC2 zinc finger domain-containing protein [Paludibacter sp.]
MAVQISQDIISKVKERADIVQVIGKSLKLTKKGRNHVGICPFHSDKTPSLIVSPQKNIYTCFACGATGDVINFVKENERITFIEAVKSLAHDYRIDLPEISMSAEDIAREKQRESVLIVLNESEKQFSKNLKSFEPASQYVRVTRQISDEMIDLYRFGYAQSDNQITREFPKLGYNFDVLMAA